MLRLLYKLALLELLVAPHKTTSTTPRENSREDLNVKGGKEDGAYDENVKYHHHGTFNL